MPNAIRKMNEEHRSRGLPEIGIGLNTGTMCVGDMGPDIRRSYMVMDDAVNLGFRLEGGSKTCAVDRVVGESTSKLARAQEWDPCDVQLFNLQRLNGQKYLYRSCAKRVASMRLQSVDPAWDGATHFETKQG